MQNHKKKLDFIGEKELVNDLSRGEMYLCLGKLILRMILEIRDCFTYFNVTSNSIIHWVN